MRPDDQFGGMQAKKKNMIIHDTECPQWDQVFVQPKFETQNSNSLSLSGFGVRGWQVPAGRGGDQWIQWLVSARIPIRKAWPQTVQAGQWFCGRYMFIWFKFVLESQVVECSMESFMHKDYRSWFICICLQAVSWRFLFNPQSKIRTKFCSDEWRESV